MAKSLAEVREKYSIRDDLHFFLGTTQQLSSSSVYCSLFVVSKRPSFPAVRRVLDEPRIERLLDAGAVKHQAGRQRGEATLAREDTSQVILWAASCSCADVLFARAGILVRYSTTASAYMGTPPAESLATTSVLLIPEPREFRRWLRTSGCLTPTKGAADISPSGSETAPASCRCTEAGRSWDGDSSRR